MKTSFVIRFTKRGSRRTAYFRPADQPDGWVRLRVDVAEEMLRRGQATEERR